VDKRLVEDYQPVRDGQDNDVVGLVGGSLDPHEDIPTAEEMSAIAAYIEELKRRVAEPGYQRRQMECLIYDQPPKVTAARKDSYERALARFRARQFLKQS
jgi:hypothetical protein